MFLLLSGDPEQARTSPRWSREARVSLNPAPIDLREILSWAADGFKIGEDWNEKYIPKPCLGDSEPARLAWNAWMEGFRKGLEVNHRKPTVSQGRWGEMVTYALPREEWKSPYA